VTRYTVVWYPFPKSELLRMRLAASDKQAITGAADAIDRELLRDANAKGVAVDDKLRELTVPPLRVLFSVSEPDRLVKVTTVALI
jgi:hypothetical protein